ncbi:acetoin utilization protein AcuC [Cohnella sp. CFH 77786]|uniref:acetoin utilization protein AcuC n=1 Tax=Cohnella sp. CFH 77786 TaxID=2662265 RepID=UPI001C610AFD|nr:acetoin utilization protein AcuC [Cohnella sp. CFH 77786]MBW5444711.1 acetoin utilization protein AcuC [Cohnella sp. CFH 77786]
MTSSAVWIDTSASRRYRFHDDHPFHPVRLELTEQLLRKADALKPSQIVAPLAESDAEEAVIALHRSDYVEAVRALSSRDPSPEAIRSADKFGLQQDGDTPYFPGMHEAALSVVAGSLAAAEAVISGSAKRALHLAGGLHHAFPERASGFCVYNDAAAAISRFRSQHGARVLYVDTDVHHGDGVQWFYYSDPDVFTFSIHETGKFLFPGTGFSHERGEAAGYGACLNIPMEPYTEDESWLACFRAGLARAADVFRPDVIVSQHGCDAHAFDPLAHIHCSMRIYREMPRIIRETADRYAQGRWVALGGGGYDHFRVVPRAWSLLWLEMSGHPLLRGIDAAHDPLALPDGWPSPGTGDGHPQMPRTWLDDTSVWTPMPRRSEIEEKNRKTLEIALQHLG